MSAQLTRTLLLLLNLPVTQSSRQLDARDVGDEAAVDHVDKFRVDDDVGADVAVTVTTDAIPPSWEPYIVRDTSKVFQYKNLGRGNYGTVSRVSMPCAPGRRFALKSQERRNETRIDTEVALMRTGSPRLLNAYAYNIGTNDKYYILMPMLRQLAAPKLQTEHDIVLLARDIIAGVVYMHDNDFVHRDIKPGNVFRTCPAGARRHEPKREDYMSTILNFFPAQPQMKWRMRKRVFPTRAVTNITEPGQTQQEQRISFLAADQFRRVRRNRKKCRAVLADFGLACSLNTSRTDVFVCPDDYVSGSRHFLPLEMFSEMEVERPQYRRLLKGGDVYAAGLTIQEGLLRDAQVLVPTRFRELTANMTSSNATTRPTAQQALAEINELLENMRISYADTPLASLPASCGEAMSQLEELIPE